MAFMKEIVLMPKISVIVPIYNVEKYLEKCLNSIVNQTFSDIEIICVNDGSTDNSLAILNMFAKDDKRIKVISQENQGISVARNNGMKVATGEYIGFVDSDDWIDLNFYEKLYDAAKRYDADIAACGIKRILKNKEKVFFNFKKERFTVDQNEKYEICYIPKHSYVYNKIYRLEELKKHNLQFEAGKYYEDLLFSAQVFFYLRSVVTVPKIFYNYVSNPMSIVGSKTTKKEEDYRDNHKKTMKFLKDNNVDLVTVPMLIEKFKIFGITVLKIRTYKYKKEYLFFNCLKLIYEFV